MTADELRAAVERRRTNVYDAPAWPDDHDEYWMSSQKFDDMKALADAYLAEQDTRRTIVLRCGYILGACRGENEMKGEARAILELLGEEPTR